MRTVLITGGAKGIGLACTERFVSDGYRVVITGRDADALEQTARRLSTVTTKVFDVADEQAWAGLGIDVDVLVANAGVAQTAPVHKTTLEQWRSMYETNATGVFLGIRAVLPGMRERGWGRIIAVASVAGHHGVRYGSAYSASKHAVLGLMRSVAAEVVASGVTANSVCPGFVATEMTDRSVRSIVDRTGRGETEARAAVEGMQPLGRLVEPAEVADAAAFLAGDGAAAINGQSIILDGGGVQQ